MVRARRDPRTPQQKAEVARIMGKPVVEKGGIDEDGEELPDRVTFPNCDHTAWEQWKLDNLPRIPDVREWCKTTFGGRQFDLFSPDQKDVPSCMSTWGVCE